MTQNKLYYNVLWVLVALSPLVYLLFAWNSVPETIRLRLNINEPVINEQSRGTLLLSTAIVSIVAAGVFLLLRNLRKIDPKVKATTPVSGFNRLGVLVVILLTVLNYFFIFTAIYSWELSEKFLYIFTAVLFALLGNYMNNIKPNFFAGIRLPWTLNDENNWRRTHNLAGKLWVGGGILLAIVAFFLPETALRPVFISTLVLMVLIPGIYSYRLYKSRD
jgi:uncharacterized membrane protein